MESSWKAASDSVIVPDSSPVFTVEDGVITAYNGADADVAPGVFNGEAVAVIISEGFERIGTSAFGNCASIQEVPLPSSLRSVLFYRRFQFKGRVGESVPGKTDSPDWPEFIFL